jgi:hypothetical protein
MTVPTQGETFAKLLEHLRLAQEDAANMAHLCNANDEQPLARAWLSITELLKRMQHNVTHLARKGLQ